MLGRVELCRTHANPALQNTFQTFGTSCIYRNERSRVPTGLHLLQEYRWALPLKALCPVSLPGKQAHGCPWNLSLNSFIPTPWVTQGSSDVMEELGLCHGSSSVTAPLRSVAELVSFCLVQRGMVPVLLHCPQQELFLIRKVKCFFPHCQRPSVYLFVVVHPAGSRRRCPSLHVTISRASCFALSYQCLWHGQDEAAAAV